MEDITEKINANTNTNTNANTSTSNTFEIASKINPSKPSKMKNKNLSFFNEDKVHHVNASASKVRSNSSKRSSLSEIKNNAEASYEKGTLLYYLAQRRSVIM